jgi:hypothetical protein
MLNDSVTPGPVVRLKGTLAINIYKSNSNNIHTAGKIHKNG